MIRLSRKDFLVPLLLLLLSAIPMVGGVMRLKSLMPGAAVSAGDGRFLAAPFPILMHVVAATFYCLLGAFQFSRGFRKQWPQWHRLAGVFLSLCGWAVALTGIWMAWSYSIPTEMQGALTFTVRLVVGAVMAISIGMGWWSIRKRRIADHEAWMMRAYALGQGAGTQAILMLPWILLSGPVIGLRRDILMTAAWLINLLVAEWILARRDRKSGRLAPVVKRRISLG